MKCFYNSCNEKAEVYLSSLDVAYCKLHFWEIAYDLLGPRKLVKIVGGKRLDEIRAMLGIIT